MSSKAVSLPAKVGSQMASIAATSNDGVPADSSVLKRLYRPS
jgi:hypothetical protein